MHGKGSLIRQMAGDRWQKFANLRAYYAFMWTHPGKKLLFMGCEFAQDREWNHDQSLDWHLLEDPMHSGVQALVGDLNRLYRDTPRCTGWIAIPTGSNGSTAATAPERAGLDAQVGRRRAPVVVVCNLTPVVREDYRIGVPVPVPGARC